jgi:hypothetical protein
MPDESGGGRSRVAAAGLTRIELHLYDPPLLLMFAASISTLPLNYSALAMQYKIYR